MLRISKQKSSMIGLFLAAAALFGVSRLPWPEEQPRAAANINVSAEQFAKHVDEWSEEEGFFDSDNFISNETSYLHVIDELQNRVQPGGVYIGVGPDQNFSYIVHTRPSLAVIVDIRRQNMLQLMFFKAVFSMATNRAEYLSLLFAKETVHVKPDASFEELLHAVRAAPTSEGLWRKNLKTVQDMLANTYKLKLSSDDLAKVEYVYRTLWKEGLDLRFSSIGRGNQMRYPRFEELLLETDAQGRHQNYLSSEELFQWLKKFQAENRLIPIVGDFAGSHAFRSVGDFLKQNGLRVSVFYTSNVEFYLFGRPDWPRYMANLHSLPLENGAVVIRAYFATYGRLHPKNVAGHRSTSMVHGLKGFIDDYDAGNINSYWEVVRR